jgi:hypothetical protein
LAQAALESAPWVLVEATAQIRFSQQLQVRQAVAVAVVQPVKLAKMAVLAVVHQQAARLEALRQIKDSQAVHTLVQVMPQVAVAQVELAVQQPHKIPLQVLA